MRDKAERAANVPVGVTNSVVQVARERANMQAIVGVTTKQGALSPLMSLFGKIHSVL